MTELEKKLTALLNKHGICVDCGEIYSHDLDEPFAHCGCHTSEWYDFTPYMKLQERARSLSVENMALIKAIYPLIEPRVANSNFKLSRDDIKTATEDRIKAISAKSWSALEDTKGRAAYEALDCLLHRCCPVSGYVISDPETRSTIEEERDKCLPKERK